MTINFTLRRQRAVIEQFLPPKVNPRSFQGCVLGLSYFWGEGERVSASPLASDVQVCVKGGGKFII